MRRTSVHWMIAIALGVCAPVAMASEGGGNPVSVDLWQAGFTIAVFLVLLFILTRFAFKPILAGLQNREEFIRKSLADAEDANNKAQEQLAAYTAQLEHARAEATAIVDEGRRDAERVKQEIHQSAEKEKNQMIEQARREIKIARDSAVRDLYDLGARLATEAAGRIIGKELTPADHERLIEQSIEQLGKLDVDRN